MRLLSLALLFISSISSIAGAVPAPAGYYRFPALHGDTLLFTAQGDLWKMSLRSGAAQPLTSHPGEESHAAISPDGKTVAFSATYEGPIEVYIMPIDGGRPTRLTYEGEAAWVVGWTPEGKVLYTTRRYSTLPESQLATVDPKTLTCSLLPLSQAMAM